MRVPCGSIVGEVMKWRKRLLFIEIIDSALLEQFDWYKDLKSYKNAQLKGENVITFDETGIVGTKTRNGILDMAEKNDEQIIAIGDNKQFESVDSECCGRKFAEIAK